MPTKQELLEDKTKDELVELADDAGVERVKKSMNKDEMVETLDRSRKLKKADL
ncbi:MAG: hypothetical protein R6X20_15370 [Phycisphaerae bacterium]